jgi:DsbC/DsbD-like thiol-disulfide interchange protein
MRKTFDMKHFTSLICATAVALTGLSAPVQAQAYDDLVKAELLPGWRMPNGDHMAALQLTLAPGWKTYWRSPGDAGIPPSFDWRGARNTRAVKVEWPAPDVFWQGGMRSVGYKDSVILPLRIALKDAGQDARLGGVIEIGLCKDVCLPHRIRISGNLPSGTTKADPLIVAALADLPYSGEDAGVTGVHCAISSAPQGLGLTVSVDMPKGTGREETVIEFRDPELWVAEPETSWQGGKLVATTRVSHMGGAAFALDRSDMVMTVLGGSLPVEVTGCD